MATEVQLPDAILESSGWDTIDITDIDEGTSSPDGLWGLVAGTNNTTVVRVSFPTPTGNPTVGTDLQEFRAWVRKTNHSTNPTGAIELYENGSLVASLTSGIAISSTTGQILTGSWNASLLGTADGSLVECRLVGSPGGGSPSNRASMEVGAVQWGVNYTPGAGPVPPELVSRQLKRLQGWNIRAR